MNNPNLTTLSDLQQLLRDLHPDYVAEFGAEAVDDAIADICRPTRYEILTRATVDDIWTCASGLLLADHPDNHGDREPCSPATGEVGATGLDHDQPRAR